MRYALSSALLMFPLLLILTFSGCQQIQQVVVYDSITTSEVCPKAERPLTVGFYAYFAPVSYSADADPTSQEFNTHQGYEADLLTALEAMKHTNLSFSREALPEWPNIWLKAAESEYDIIGGGITILESRTRDARGTSLVTFTSGHIKFRQSLLVRVEDAVSLSSYAALTRDIRVGVLSGTTGEARLLEITGIVDTEGILIEGTRIETSESTVVTDGTKDYTITASGATPVLAGRRTLYPPLETMPQVIYLGDEVGESELLEALSEGSIDAVARGEIGNRNAAYATNDAFVVSVLDDQVEYGGFTLSLADTELAVCIDERLNYLTDDSNIGYGEWLADPQVFMTRAELWNETRR